VHEWGRGTLAAELPFLDATNSDPVDPAVVRDMLVGCGVLNRNRTNRKIQFAYGPVAEQPAASEPGRSAKKKRA
jgi:hypothetical protein